MSAESDRYDAWVAAEAAGHLKDHGSVYASAAQAAAPAGGTGATAGAYDTAAHRDALIALVNAMRDVLIAAGLMKGSA